MDKKRKEGIINKISKAWARTIDIYILEVGVVMGFVFVQAANGLRRTILFRTRNLRLIWDINRTIHFICSMTN